jgi:hypothetical protein
MHDLGLTATKIKRSSRDALIGCHHGAAGVRFVQ